MKLLLVVAFTLCMIPSLAEEQPRSLDSTGNDFLELCGMVNKDSGSMNALEKMQSASCFYYVAGMLQGMTMENIRIGVLEKRDIPFSFDESTVSTLPRVQIVRIVLKYIKENPEQAHLRTGLLFTDALEKAFPPSKR